MSERTPESMIEQFATQFRDRSRTCILRDLLGARPTERINAQRAEQLADAATVELLRFDWTQRHSGGQNE
jgi:hypothetical protein